MQRRYWIPLMWTQWDTNTIRTGLSQRIFGWTASCWIGMPHLSASMAKLTYQ